MDSGLVRIGLLAHTPVAMPAFQYVYQRNSKTTTLA